MNRCGVVHIAVDHGTKPPSWGVVLVAMNEQTRRTVNRGATATGPDLLGLYLDEAGSFPLLTKADEMRLGQAIQAAQAAREELDGRGP